MAVKPVPDGASKFDVGQLPERPLLDTGVWLRALGWEHDADKLCAHFVAALQINDKRLLMATATLAEILRGDPKRPVPNPKAVVRLAFDTPAAIRLGQTATAEWLGQFPDGVRRGIKFDALIAATGREGGATCMVAWDEGSFMRKICDALGLPLHHPRDFLAKQKTLEFGTPVAAATKADLGFGRIIDLGDESKG